jgi:hypothetical protein
MTECGSIKKMINHYKSNIRESEGNVLELK